MGKRLLYPLLYSGWIWRFDSIFWGKLEKSVIFVARAGWVTVPFPRSAFRHANENQTKCIKKYTGLAESLPDSGVQAPCGGKNHQKF
jgi:hypothetical protein